MITEDEEGAADEGTPAWMATFADLMSLLLTFFILILSFANMDVIKFSAAVESLQDAFGTAVAIHELDGSLITAPIDLAVPPRSRLLELDSGGAREAEHLLREITAMIERSRLDNLVEVEETDRGIVVRVIGQLLFDAGSIDLRPESFILLNEIARIIHAVGRPISIEGHTDDTPASLATPAANWHLSADRAISVLDYLTNVHGVAPHSLSISGFSSTRPLLPNDSEENREANRRVEFVFLRSTSQNGPSSG